MYDKSLIIVQRNDEKGSKSGAAVRNDKFYGRALGRCLNH